MAPDQTIAINGFSGRNALGSAHERRISSVLVACGWDVWPFGQAMLESALRRALSRFEHLPLRWMPDLVCVKGDVIVMVDAKACTERNKDKPNHALERDAYSAHIRWSVSMRTEMRYVWHDLSWSSVQQITRGLADGQIRNGPYRGAGSGTAFLLIPRREPWVSSTDIRHPSFAQVEMHPSQLKGIK